MEEDQSVEKLQKRVQYLSNLIDDERAEAAKGNAEFVLRCEFVENGILIVASFDRGNLHYFQGNVMRDLLVEAATRMINKLKDQK